MDKYVFWLLLVAILVVGFIVFAWIVSRQPLNNLEKKSEELGKKAAKALKNKEK